MSSEFTGRIPQGSAGTRHRHKHLAEHEKGDVAQCKKCGRWRVCVSHYHHIGCGVRPVFPWERRKLRAIRALEAEADPGRLEPAAGSPESWQDEAWRSLRDG